MTRKDTILISVVINAALLAILFATAIIYDTEKIEEQPDLQPTVVQPIEPAPEPAPIASTGTTGDEVDNVLKYYSQPSTQQAAESPVEPFVPTQAHSDEEDKDEKPQTTSEPSEEVVEVTVKKGDVLEKIAKANGTTVSAIKKASNLQTERLSIGQVLKVPVNKSAAAAPKPAKASTSKETASGDAEYYIVKSGDNPWKIAKKFNITSDDILKLNNMDEEKARNLKAGDRIRVK